MAKINLPSNFSGTPVFASAEGVSNLAAVMAKIGEFGEVFADFKAKHQSELAELNNKIAGASFHTDGADKHAAVKARRDLGDYARGIKAAMTTDSNPDGGFLIEPQHDRAIRRVWSQTSAMRRVADVVSISAGSYVRTINLLGAAAGWVSEQEGRPQTQGMKLSQIEIVAHEMYAMPALTQKLMDDAVVDIGAEVESTIGMKFDAMEGDAFINGDGAGKPMGLLQHATIADATWTWGKLGFIKSGDASGFIAPTVSASPADCLTDMLYALRVNYRANATWLMNSKTASVVRKYKDADGRYLWSDSLVVGQPSTLLGYSVQIDEAMPDVAANKFPIAFGDFRQSYVVADRLGTRVVRDPYSLKPYVLFYTTRRVGGGVVNYEGVKLLKIAA